MGVPWQVGTTVVFVVATVKGLQPEVGDVVNPQVTGAYTQIVLENTLFPHGFLTRKVTVYSPGVLNKTDKAFVPTVHVACEFEFNGFAPNDPDVKDHSVAGVFGVMVQ